MDEEYLKLFEKIRKEEQKELTEKNKIIKETGNYDNLQNINEVNRNPYDFNNFNTNEFNIETRVNGNQFQRENLNEIRKFDRESKQEKLNEVLRRREQERLNEVKRIKEQERLNEIKRQEEDKLRKEQEEQKRKQEEMQRLNENVDFKNSDVVTLEMFNRARYNSMVSLGNKIKQ